MVLKATSNDRCKLIVSCHNDLDLPPPDSPNFGRQRHFGDGSKLKNIVAADSDDENEMNNETPVPTSSEMQNIMKSMRSYLDAHSNGEMNNKMVDIKQF
ncbi:hypothetical protein TNCV_3509241 [Trichonephila clavipes]|nr:hypothetical protein TNCV_3509241 [Trichonephila clavipes]